MTGQHYTKRSGRGYVFEDPLFARTFVNQAMRGNGIWGVLDPRYAVKAD